MLQNMEHFSKVQKRCTKRTPSEKMESGALRVSIISIFVITITVDVLYGLHLSIFYIMTTHPEVHISTSRSTLYPYPEVVTGRPDLSEHICLYTRLCTFVFCTHVIFYWPISFCFPQIQFLLDRLGYRNALPAYHCIHYRITYHCLILTHDNVKYV